MIVEEPPYDLIVLLADEDARRFVMSLIERGQQTSCLRPFRWRAMRDPRKDTVFRNADAVLRPFLGIANCRFVIIWDHHGSGREQDKARDVEQAVAQSIERAGIKAEDVLAISFEPELEISLVPVWKRTVDELAKRRTRAAPTDAEILRQMGAGSTDLAFTLGAQPKEAFDAVLRLLNLRHSAELFEDLGKRLSVPLLKSGDALRRLTAGLVKWFPPEGQ